MPLPHSDVLDLLTGCSRDPASPILYRSVMFSLRGRFYNVVDVVNQLETETRAGRQGRIADHLTRLDFVILDELGYLPVSWQLPMYMTHCAQGASISRLSIEKPRGR